MKNVVMMKGNGTGVGKRVVRFSGEQQGKAVRSKEQSASKMEFLDPGHEGARAENVGVGIWNEDDWQVRKRGDYGEQWLKCEGRRRADWE